MSAARTVLIIIGALLSICGTFVFALFYYEPFPGIYGVGSGIGFAMNLLDLFAIDPVVDLGVDALIFYLMLVLFIVWLVSGVLQLVGLKSRVVGIIFSLVPLGMGIMFVLFFYTDILGDMTSLFTYYTLGEYYGDFFPIFFGVGAGPFFGLTVGLGPFFLVGGGALGFVGSILPKD